MARSNKLAAAILVMAVPTLTFAFQQPTPRGNQQPARKPQAGANDTQVPATRGQEQPVPALRQRNQDSTAQQRRLDDRLFAVVASESGMAEITLSHLAVQRASSEEVKKYAQQMLEEHTNAQRQLMSAAQTAQVPTQRELSPAKQAEYLILASKNGEDFDRAYADQQLAAHICAVALYQAESEMGQNQELKQLASETLPKLKEHLQMARRLPGTLSEAQAGDIQPGQDNINAEPGLNTDPTQTEPATPARPGTEPATPARPGADSAAPTRPRTAPEGNRP